MADQVPILGSDSSTYLVATDTISGSEYQRVKNGYGADGSYTDVVASSGMPIAPQFEEVTGSAAANNTDLVAQKDVRAYRTACFQLTGTWTATVSAQGSNDGTTWTTLTTFDAFAPAVGYTTRTSNGVYYCMLPGFRYFRLRTTAYTSGTANAVVEFTAQPAWYAPNVTTTTAVYSYSSPSDGAANNTTAGANVLQTVFNGATWDRQRVPSKFATATATTSGNTGLYTPTSAKKFRLMRYIVEVTSNAKAATAGVLDITFQDSATGMPLGHSVMISDTTSDTTGGWTTGWVDLGNGILSAAANNVLNVNLSIALTAGKLRVTAALTEE